MNESERKTVKEKCERKKKTREKEERGGGENGLDRNMSVAATPHKSTMMMMTHSGSHSSKLSTSLQVNETVREKNE